MNWNSTDLWPQSWRILRPGEARVACGLVLLAVAIALMHFVMGLFLAALPAPFAGGLLAGGIAKARNRSAPVGRQWAGIGLLLLGFAALAVITFNACSLSYDLALHAHRPTAPLPDLSEWLRLMGSCLVPALLIGPGLRVWTDWSPRRCIGWGVIMLLFPLLALMVHQILAEHGFPLTT